MNSTSLYTLSCVTNYNLEWALKKSFVFPVLWGNEEDIKLILNEEDKIEKKERGHQL